MIKRTINRIRIGSIAVLLLLSGALYLWLPFIALEWATIPFAGFVTDPNLIVNSSAESHWAGQQVSPPITYPQRLIAIDGQPIADTNAFHALIRQQAVGDTLEFTFVQSENDATTRTIPITLIQIDNESMWSQFWLLYLTGVGVLTIGAWTYIARPKTRPAQIFTGFTILASLVIGGLFDLNTTHRFVRIWVLAVSLAGSLHLILAMRFPHPISFLGWRPRLGWVVIIPGLIIAVWGQIWLYNGPTPWSYAMPWRAAYQLNAITILLSLLIMGYRGFRSPAPVVRQQGRIILLGAIAGFLPVLVFLIVASTRIPTPIWFGPSVFIPPIIIYPLAIGYTIMRYGLLNIDVVLRRTLTYVLLTVLLVGVFSLGLSLITYSVGPEFVRSRPILLALFIVLVTVLFDPLRTRLQQAIVAKIFKKPISYDQLLRTYNRELKTAVNVHEVAISMLKCVQQGIPQAEANLYLPDGNMGGYSKYRGRQHLNANGHLTSNQHLFVDPKSPLVTFLQEGPGIVDLAEERIWPLELREHRDTVKALDAAVVVPMNNTERLLGWLTLSHKNNQKHFNSGEMSFLSSLADQSLIGLERANVIQRLETRITELDHLSQFSQTLNLTESLDHLPELVYRNFKTLFGIHDLSLALTGSGDENAFVFFCVENNRREFGKEGLQQVVGNRSVLQAMRLSQMVSETDENGRFQITVPLSAGTHRLGAIQMRSRLPGQTLSERQCQLLTVLTDQIANALDRLNSQEQLKARAQELSTINEIVVSLTSTLELDRLLELILDKAMELLDTEAGTFMLTQDNSGELEFRVVRGPNSEKLIGTRLPIGAGLAGQVAQNGKATLVNHAQQDKRWFGEVNKERGFDTRSILTVPLLEGNKVLGVIQAINKQDGSNFQEEDKRLLTAFAAQAVIALKNARLLAQTDEALQDRVNELSLLQQLDRDLNTTLDLNRVLELALGRIVPICGGSAGAIVLLDEEKQPQIRMTLGRGTTVSQPKGLVNEALRDQEWRLVPNIQKADDYVETAVSSQSALIVPLVHNQETIGAMLIEHEQTNGFGAEVVETAVRLTTHAAGAIANALLHQEVLAANQAKSEFVSMVSHELKTPMTSMSGFTDLILSGAAGPVNPQQTQFLHTIKSNIKRMGNQIQDLTDISQIETGRLSVKPEPTPVADIVNETMETIQQICDDKETTLALTLPPDLPNVLADKNRMVQVLTNLLSNACKYSPRESHVELTFSTGIQPRPKTNLQQPVIICRVKDNGYGISEEDQEQLFTKFFRSADPNIRRARGTGLGLSITKGLIELHGGTISVESCLGEGTTFQFTIPIE
ncbi:MAG: GAF domain-containing protein [Chloroflexota bacterium]